MSRRPSGEQFSDKDLDVEAYASSVGINLEDDANLKSTRTAPTSIPPLANARPIRLKPLGSQVPRHPRTSTTRALTTIGNSTNSPSSSTSSSNRKTQSLDQTSVFVMSPLPSTSDSSPSDQSKLEVSRDTVTKTSAAQMSSSSNKSSSPTIELVSNLPRETSSKSSSPEPIRSKISSKEIQDMKLKKEEEFRVECRILEEEFAKKLDDYEQEANQRHSQAMEDFNEQLALEVKRKEALIEEAKKDFARVQGELTSEHETNQREAREHFEALLAARKEHWKKWFDREELDLQTRSQEQLRLLQNQNREALEVESAKIEQTKASIQDTLILAIQETLKATLQSQLTAALEDIHRTKSSNNETSILVPEKEVECEPKNLNEAKSRRRKSMSDLEQEATLHDTGSSTNDENITALPVDNIKDLTEDEGLENRTRKTKKDKAKDPIQNVFLRFLQDQKRLIKKKRGMLESTRNRLMQLCLYDIQQHKDDHSDDTAILYEEMWNSIHSNISILQREIQQHDQLVKAFSYNDKTSNWRPLAYPGLKQQVREVLRELLGSRL